MANRAERRAAGDYAKYDGRLLENDIDEEFDDNIIIEDEREPIYVDIKKQNGEIETLEFWFDPRDIFIYEHIEALEKPLKIPEKIENYKTMSYAVKKMTTYLNNHFDGIFGSGSAREIFRYAGNAQRIIDKIMKQVRQKLEDFGKQSEEEKNDVMEQIESESDAKADAILNGE